MKRLAFVLLGTAVCAVAALACQETPGTEFPIEPGSPASGAVGIPNQLPDGGSGAFPDAIGDAGPFDGPFGNDGGTIFQDGPGPTP